MRDPSQTRIRGTTRLEGGGWGLAAPCVFGQTDTKEHPRWRGSMLRSSNTHTHTHTHIHEPRRGRAGARCGLATCCSGTWEAAPAGQEAQSAHMWCQLEKRLFFLPTTEKKGGLSGLLFFL